MVVRETSAMIAGMKPELVGGEYVFCTAPDPMLAARCLPGALAMFREREGTSFIMPLEEAGLLGFDCSIPMRQITLNIFSALDGLGLTRLYAAADANGPDPSQHRSPSYRIMRRRESRVASRCNPIPASTRPRDGRRLKGADRIPAAHPQHTAYASQPSRSSSARRREVLDRAV
ncbi:hypothetical protein CVN68_05730 [Sphingomonas psychrotolerans]|uniref:DUF2241 domain-containing protein n=1 Tax=Sphingomonas psychrotolerans TaxID=1327635 RepID=A0A2K8MCC3_9SPHN|nr:hypothetical protein CVN68_05730 [Sphingomonas psychrotolerans]